MHTHTRPALLTVTPQESGQKLLQYLQRRVGRGVPRSAVMRWIRTGQVRVDKKRAQPFQRLEAGQIVRLPPYSTGADPLMPERVHKQVSILHQDQDMLVAVKPAGLPVHGGSGHDDSLHSRLCAMFPDAPFSPTPAHRLDKDTSGLLLVALSYNGLRELHELFQAGRLRKDYLAWVNGAWPHYDTAALRDLLDKTQDMERERMTTGAGKPALAWAQPLCVQKDKSLLLVQLSTGRTHQIRVQLASRGQPVIGDLKYGGPKCPQGMLLHAFRLELYSKSYILPAPWTGVFAVPEDIPRLNRPPE